MWLNSFTWPLSYCSALLPINGKGKQIIFQLLLGNWYISCLATDALFNPCFSISAQLGLIRSAVIESADGGLNCPNYQLLTYELMIMNLNWDDSERPRPAGDVTAPLISYLLCSKWGIFVNSTWIERNTWEMIHRSGHHQESSSLMPNLLDPSRIHHFNDHNFQM